MTPTPTLFAVDAVADDPRTVRGAMLVLMARCGNEGPIQLRAVEHYSSEMRRQIVTYTAIVGETQCPMRIVDAWVGAAQW